MAKIAVRNLWNRAGLRIFLVSTLDLLCCMLESNFFRLMINLSQKHAVFLVIFFLATALKFVSCFFSHQSKFVPNLTEIGDLVGQLMPLFVVELCNPDRFRVRRLASS